MDIKSILNGTDLKIESIKIPGWGGGFCIRQLSGIEHAEFEDSRDTIESKGTNQDHVKAVALFCAYVVCDKNGKRKFTNKHSEKLVNQPFNILMHIFNKGMSLNKINDDIEKVAKN